MMTMRQSTSAPFAGGECAPIVTVNSAERTQSAASLRTVR